MTALKPIKVALEFFKAGIGLLHICWRAITFKPLKLD